MTGGDTTSKQKRSSVGIFQFSAPGIFASQALRAAGASSQKELVLVI